MEAYPYERYKAASTEGGMTPEELAVDIIAHVEQAIIDERRARQNPPEIMPYPYERFRAAVLEDSLTPEELAADIVAHVDAQFQPIR